MAVIQSSRLDTRKSCANMLITPEEVGGKHYFTELSPGPRQTYYYYYHSA